MFFNVIGLNKPVIAVLLVLHADDKRDALICLRLLVYVNVSKIFIQINQFILCYLLLVLDVLRADKLDLCILII